jgi:ABC-2 type transport system ATP-binding protein
MPSQAPAIEVVGISKRFGDVVALDDVSLNVPRGTVLGLLGPNGAGKTTTVRVLTTTLLPDQGTATVLGTDVAKDPDTVRRHIGLAGQFAAVDEMLTGTENLEMVGRLAHLDKKLLKRRAVELLARFELDEAAGRQVRTYSGGMRRRLDLAAALVHRPPVLFLDEPTTGLDPQSRNNLWTVIEELVAEGTTVLLTTQYLEEADQLADRIMVIDHGRVIAEGTSAELKERLGATVLEVILADDPAAARAETVLGSLAAQGSRLERDANVVRLTVDDGPATAMAALRALDGDGLSPSGLALREPSLDDVFLALTGHKAEEAPDPTDDKAPAATGRGRRNSGGAR